MSQTVAHHQRCGCADCQPPIYASGYVDALDALDNTRRFWPVGQQQVDDTSPCNWVGHITDGKRCSDGSAHYHHERSFSGFYAWRDSQTGVTVHSGERHAYHDIYGHPNLWLVRISEAFKGRTWETTVRAVTDDFGWLVEVPTC